MGCQWRLCTHQAATSTAGLGPALRAGLGRAVGAVQAYSVWHTCPQAMLLPQRQQMACGTLGTESGVQSRRRRCGASSCAGSDLAAPAFAAAAVGTAGAMPPGLTSSGAPHREAAGGLATAVIRSLRRLGSRCGRVPASGAHQLPAASSDAAGGKAVAAGAATAWPSNRQLLKGDRAKQGSWCAACCRVGRNILAWGRATAEAVAATDRLPRSSLA